MTNRCEKCGIGRHVPWRMPMAGMRRMIPLSIDMPAQLHQQLGQYARDRNTSMAAVLRDLLIERLAAEAQGSGA